MNCCATCQWYEEEKKGKGRCQVFDSIVKGSRGACCYYTEIKGEQKVDNDTERRKDM